MRSLDFAVEPRGGGLDVGVADAAVHDVPVEAGLELGAVVGLDRLDSERKPFQHVVQELDSGLLVVAGVDAQQAYTPGGRAPSTPPSRRPRCRSSA